jgi:hypothetical protein
MIFLDIIASSLYDFCTVTEILSYFNKQEANNKMYTSGRSIQGDHK